MKENLKLKLDLLQARLARINEHRALSNGKLAPTKHVLRHLKPTDENPEELERSIEATKKELVDRKIHHTITVVQRNLKTFKPAEKRRIAKRIKNEKEGSPKISVLNQESDFVDQMDPATLAQDLVMRSVTKKVEGFASGYERASLSSIASNIYGRAGKAPAVKDAIDHLLKSLAEYYTVAGVVKQIDTTAEAQVGAVESQGSSKPETAEPEFGGFSDWDGDEPNDAEMEVDDDKNNDDNGKAPEPERDTFFEDLDESGDERLPMMTTGYISGSDDDDDIPEIEPEGPKVRKNRRGQRARRKIWEQKFGNRANHVLKEKSEREEKKRVQQARRDAKEVRQQRKVQEAQALAAKPLHPSWEAKRKAKEAQVQIKFEGKKKVFS